jgi:hypothetical protein
MPLYGPFTVFTRDGLGNLTTTPLAGVYYITDTATYARNASVLASSVSSGPGALQHVIAGDDPANPTRTVQVSFATQALADAAIAQLV